MASTEVPFRILPKLNDLNRGFWTGGEHGELRFLRCQNCGYYNHPPTPLCPMCHSKRLESEAVSGTATLHTYSVNHQPWMPGPELPFVVAIADKGWKRALADDVHLRQGLNVALGKVTCRPVADAHGFAWTDAAALVA